jgi:hypothetical protein
MFHATRSEPSKSRRHDALFNDLTHAIIFRVPLKLHGAAFLISVDDSTLAYVGIRTVNHAVWEANQIIRTFSLGTLSSGIWSRVKAERYQRPSKTYILRTVLVEVMVQWLGHARSKMFLESGWVSETCDWILEYDYSTGIKSQHSFRGFRNTYFGDINHWNLSPDDRPPSHIEPDQCITQPL